MMKNRRIDEFLLENVSSYYKAIGNSKRLIILLEIRENFISGAKWASLKDATDLSSGALKRHIDSLTEQGLIGKARGNYRITEWGLKLMIEMDKVIEKMKKRQRKEKIERLNEEIEEIPTNSETREKGEELHRRLSYISPKELLTLIDSE